MISQKTLDIFDEVKILQKTCVYSPYRILINKFLQCLIDDLRTPIKQDQHLAIPSNFISSLELAEKACVSKSCLRAWIKKYNMLKHKELVIKALYSCYEYYFNARPFLEAVYKHCETKRSKNFAKKAIDFFNFNEQQEIQTKNSELFSPKISNSIS